MAGFPNHETENGKYLENHSDDELSSAASKAVAAKVVRSYPAAMPEMPVEAQSQVTLGSQTFATVGSVVFRIRPAYQTLPAIAQPEEYLLNPLFLNDLVAKLMAMALESTNMNDFIDLD